ncbi:hypothetical protein AV654_21140 [Paenibacillus elgii]|uniref:Uncharacterized protein n=1 Tax=Paenibacillus elgii TaxID=189691 RepID=A0A165R0M4_9BACL|nr:hypothetical protein [Paenibacillus elgii]KZE77582.1 hypothetical protein AV654_21140 [Paenibacillus elgii]
MAYEAKTNWQLDDTVTEQDMNRIEQGLKDAYENSLISPPPEQVNLGYGLQVVDAKRTAPLENICIKGRTLVNLLGRDGNFESSPTGWSNFQSTTVFDTANKSYGLQSLKVNITSTSGGIVRTGQTFKAGKYYLVSADIKNGNASLAFISLDSLGQSNTVSDKTKFSIAYRKVNPASDTTINVSLLVNGAVDQYAYFDGVRIYEITQTEYNAIDSMTPEQISVKWPYVDDIKSIYSPYIIKHGENLLPPFTEWNVTAGSGGTPKMSVDDAYSVNLIADQSGQAVYVDIPVIPNTTYTLSLPSLPVNGYIGFNSFDANMQFVSAYGGFTSDASKTITTEGNVRYLKVIFGNNTFGAGIYKFIKPMLNLGPKAKTFKPLNEDYLFFPNVQLASNADGTVYDTLFQRDGKYWKLTRFKTVELSGSVKWDNLSKDVGVKAITTDKNTLSDALLGTNSLGITSFVKYNGKLLADYPGKSNIPDTGWIAADQSVRVAISNVDSGWGDLYDPSSEDIGAYFNGWRMCDTSDPTGKTPYNKSGTQGWFWVTDTSANPSIIFSLPTYRAGNGWKPYSLQYQLAKSTPEEIIVEGGITFHEGLNQIEIGNGLVVREQASPFFNGDTNTYVNNIFLGGGASKLKNKTLKILKVYRNELEDNARWIFYKGAHTFGQSEAYAKLGNYNPSAAYTVTYLTLDQYSLTCNVLSIQGEYAGNVRTAVDTMAAGQADLLARVSVLENTKAQKLQGQWITPTLLNGWVSEGSGYSNPGYYKDQFGNVHLSGVIRSGVTSTFTVLFYLPARYRPKNRLNLAIFTFDGSSTGICSLHIEADGSVKIGSINCKQYISLDGISFLAEQ